MFLTLKDSIRINLFENKYIKFVHSCSLYLTFYPDGNCFVVLYLFFPLMHIVKFKPISLDSDSRSDSSASFHTVSCMPDILHKDWGIATLLERIACTACNSYWAEQLGNNCCICKPQVPHEVLSKTVVSYCSARHSCRYSISLNTLVHMCSGMIRDRSGEQGVLEVAWGNTLAQEEGVGVDCSRFVSMLGSIWLGMLRDMLVGAAEEEEVVGEGEVGEYSS